MHKRSFSSASPSASASIGDVSLARLRAHGRQIKASTVKMLLDLQASGALDGDDNETSLRKKLKEDTERHSKVVTEYGPMVQQIEIGTSKLAKWDVCDPCAFLYYMSSISMPFCSVMRTCVQKAGSMPLRLVIFMDEMVPGNPFRPDKGRKLMCIYWTFVDWPGWMLTRSFAWPCFSILRSSVMELLDGGASYLTRVILRHFFPESGESLERGIVLKDPLGEPYVVKAMFVGFLCDLAGHKEIEEV